MSIRFLLIATLAATALLAGPLFAAPEIGQPAPDFTARSADGQTVELSALRGRTVILEWTNHECPFVQKHYQSGNMQDTQTAAAEHDVLWFQVISSEPGSQGHVSPERALELNSERKVSAIEGVLLDEAGTIGKLYGAQVTPHIYIIDPAGVLRYNGAIDNIASARIDDIAKATNHVRAALDALQAGEEVPNAVNRAYGCTIKYAS